MKKAAPDKGGPFDWPRGAEDRPRRPKPCPSYAANVRFEAGPICADDMMGSIVRKPQLATSDFSLRQNGLRIYRENKAHAPISLPLLRQNISDNSLVRR